MTSTNKCVASVKGADDMAEQPRELNQRGGDERTAITVWARAAAACGIVYVILDAIGLGLWPIPDPGASRSAIASAFTGAASAQMRVGQFLSVLAALLFLPFAVRVWSASRRVEGVSGPLSAIMLTGSLILVISQLAGVATFNALALRAGHGLSGAEAITLFDLGQAFFVVVWTGGAVFTGAVAALSLRQGVLPAWLGITAAIVAVGFLAVVPVPTSGIKDVPASLFYLWVLAAGIVLMRTPRSAASTVPSAAETSSATA
jgi:hypothetical protein